MFVSRVCRVLSLPCVCPRPFSTLPVFLSGVSPYPPPRTRMLQQTKDYQALIESFTWPHAYATPNTPYNIGVDICDKWALSSSGHRVAVIYEDVATNHTVTCTFKQAYELSNRLSNALVGLGLQSGDRVALLLSQSIETAVAHMSIYKSGAIALPLFILFGPEALEYRLRDSGAKFIFVESSKVDEIVALKLSGSLPELKHIIVAPPLSAIHFQNTQQQQYSLYNKQAITNNNHADLQCSIHHLSHLLTSSSSVFTPVVTSFETPALIIYTSGTTGPPKGALHAHRVLLGHLPGVEFPHNFFPQRDDLFWTPADWAWIGGLIDVLLPSLHHGISVLAQRFPKFDADKAFHTIEKHRVKNMFMPPTALKMMRSVDKPNQKYKLHVRSIGSGGESLGDSLLDWGKETFGVTINEFYGQTECNLVLGNCSSLFAPRPGSMGRPIPGHTVCIVDEQGTPLQHGKVGNIAIKKNDPVMMLRYWNKPEATADKYRGDYLLTGDLGLVDPEGYFWFFGRQDDVIKSSGYRIGPSEIENCIVGHAAVLNCAVIGVKDDLRGELVKAYIVVKPDTWKRFATRAQGEETLKDEIATYVKGKLAAYEYPRLIEFVDALPMTTTGKIIRKDLKDQHARDHTQAGSKTKQYRT